ncbi:MAG: virulence RhuM family protein [Bacteroidales bacterium]|nr:virulence RhuM family protein [Bacteroidales bacterium]
MEQNITDSSPKSEIILYQPNEIVSLEVRLDAETVWLSQQQMKELFNSSKQNISLHINNIYKEGELDVQSTVKEYLTVQKEGSRSIQRKVKYYNLDVIISVGYRVKSLQGTLFRQWANKVLKEYLLRGYSVNQRLQYVEEKIDMRLSQHEKILQEHQDKIDFFVKTSLPPVEGIFFDGQIFDAYELVCRLIKSAKQRIVLIDNYIDETTLTMLDKRSEGVSATIYTHSIGDKLQLDIDRHNAQYQPIIVNRLKKSHDRFLILDDDVYHVGASLKDLGKQWFAIMRMNEIHPNVILNMIR